MPLETHSVDDCRAITHKPKSSEGPVQLPCGVALKRGRIHEITGQCADGFIASTIRLTQGPVIWIGRPKDVYSVCPLAVIPFFDPSRLITTECHTRRDILWAAEQALRSKGSDSVVIELSLGPDFRESRRLQLAAEEGRTLGLILIQRTAQHSACETRWACHPASTAGLAANDRQWVWQLKKNKAGHIGTWQVTWEKGRHATHHVHLVSPASA